MPTLFHLWRKARRVNSAASWLPGTNRLGFQPSMAVSDRDQDKQKVMNLSHEEFIRRFLLHVLPQGLMRIRHLATCCRKRRLPKIRTAIDEATTPEQTQAVPESTTGIRVASRLWLRM